MSALTLDTVVKVLNEDGTPCHGGSGQWALPHGARPGKWMPKIAHPAPCERGYHIVTIAQLPCWVGPALWTVEARGERIDAADKSVVGQARLLARIDTWDETTARLFAADVSERTLGNFERLFPDDDRPRRAIIASRAYARGEISKDQLDAADSAARSAADSAAGSAERAWQADRLLCYLDGQAS